MNLMTRLKRERSAILEWAERRRQEYIDATQFQNAANMRDLIALAKRPFREAKRRSR